jgi:flagellar motor switch protein FliG
VSEAVAEETLGSTESEAAAPAAAEAALPAARQLKIRGPRKAAIVAQQLGAEATSKIFSELNPRQLDQILIEIAELETQPATPEERNLALQEFFHVHLAQNYVTQGGLDFARSALEMAMGVEQAEQILGRLRGVFEVQPFDFLRKIAPQQITSFLISEQPQVIAVVLAYMPAELGARVLESLPPHLKSDVS